MSWVIDRMSIVLRGLISGLITLYQWLVSPLLGTNCRHLPSCSHYAKDALKLHGLLHGSYFALKRILRCHPWAKPMVDPVPPPSRAQPTTKLKG
jgi:putative membrane protein insertion efficiency factor